MKSSKEIVKAFYESDFVKNKNLLEDFLHSEVLLLWNNSNGLSTFKFEDLKHFFEEIRRTYSELRVEISHLLSCENQVTIRYYVARIMEDEEEIGIAHFMTIWEVKDNKLYRGYQISQPVSKMDEVNQTYHSGLA